MSDFDYPLLLQNAPFAFANHRIVLNEIGEVVDFIFLDVNPLFEELTGMQAKTLINKKATSILPGLIVDSEKWIKFYGDLALHGKSVDFEQYAEPLGRRFKIHAHGYRKNHFYTLITDITAEYLLTEAAGKLNQYSTENIDYAYLTNVMMRLTGARYAALNRFDENGKDFTTVSMAGMSNMIVAATKMLGFEITGKKWPFDPAREALLKNKTNCFDNLEILTTKALPKQIIKRLVAMTGIGEVVVIRTVKDDLPVGDFTLFFQKGKQLQNQRKAEYFADMVGILLGRIMEEKKKKRQENILENFFDVTPELLCITDTKGAFIKLNKAWHKALGYRSETLANRNFIELVHEDDRKKTLIRTKKQLEKKELISFVNRFRAADGKYRLIEWRSVLFDGLIFAAARDITEKRLAEETIRENERRLHELNATKDKFFSIIAHDLRSPFNSILGGSEMLAEIIRKKDYENMEEMADMVHRSAQAAFNLLVNLLEWSRAQTGRIDFDPVAVDIGPVIDENLELLAESAKQKSILIHKSIAVQSKVSLDVQMFGTILRNLVSNAIKFSHAGSLVRVRARLKDDKLLVSVTDQGVGISKEVQEKLFRIDSPISQSGTNNEPGTGLGLLLCKEFAEKHGGTIVLESLPQKGSTFTLVLPVNPDE